MLPNSIIRLVHRFRHRPDPRRIARDVDYALDMTRAYLAIAERAHIDLSSANILEVGPGPSFAPQLVFASHGAKVAVADPFLVDWDTNYHVHFYRAFRDRWSGPTAALDRVIESESYAGIVTCIYEPVETIASVNEQSFDLLLSNAVLEHARDPIKACSTLARLTKPNGVQSHQIDYRDHLNRPQPLEFLTKSNTGFWIQRTCHPSQGNRMRHSEWLKAFEAVGLSIETAEENMVADDAYLDTLVHRLRKSNSRYHEWPLDDLRILGAKILVRRTPKTWMR
jgi:SAM-dependent methyltransferase